MNESKTKLMHEAALRVLANYQTTGEPFALFLSSWSFDQNRQEVLEFLKEIGMAGQAPNNVQVRIGLERQVRILLQMQKLETVAVYRKNDEERIALPDEWPSLVLADDEWRDRVAEAAAWADLIVLFWGADTPGLDEELKICSSAANRLKTVAVMKSTPTEIYLSQVVKTFPRVVSLSEIPPLIGLHPEFTPLIERMKAIHALKPKDRARLIDPKKRVKKFPWPATTGRFEGKMWVESHQG